jgi:heme/copper-type cytochrome/quinol oxidase subunit 2
MSASKTAIAKDSQHLPIIILWVTVILYAASLPYVILFFWRHRQESSKLRPELESGTRNNRTTALLWVMSPLAILISINLLVMWVPVAGSEFR